MVNRTPAATRERPESVPLDELKKRLGFSAGGLDAAAVQHRITEFGYNEIPEKKVNPVLKLVSYFWGPLPGMIEIAAVLSAVLGRWPDFGVITALLVLNGIVGFRQEHQAANAVAALKARLALLARVKRNGAWASVPARELVPGDIIRLRLGDIVPADSRLLEGDPIEVDQSSLTGESLPVERKAGEVVYSGSVIRQGEVDALVFATGGGTYYGKTVQLVEVARTRSHFQRAVIRIANYLIAIAIVLAVLILVVAVLRGDVLLQVLEFALVLTIASVPVALPTVLSVTMAIGAKTLARKEAIVTRLSAVEELAGADVICSDKTGTLTKNKLAMGTPFAVSGVTPEEVVLNGALASREENNDPIDLAVLAAVKDDRLGGYRVTHFQPFDPVRKRTEATVTAADGHNFRTTKGAYQVIMALASNAERVRAEVEQAVNEFASRGYRSLAVARAEDGEWRLLGIIPLFDELREDSRETVEMARRMGISLKMVTGDQTAIARETAAQLGLGGNIVDASVFATREGDGEVADAIEKADGFAQVFPEHKYRIVEVLQKRGHIVGMTGDGVNDAPALKKADVGIAVAGSTDAARAAAAIVLLGEGLSVIIEGVKEARKTFQRMTNYAIYRISETIRVLLFLTLSILVFNFYPVTAIMIVLLAIMNDGAILSIAYDNVRFSERPESWQMKRVLAIATVLGLVGVVSSFLLFYLGEKVFGVGAQTIQSLMYLKLSVAGHFAVFVARTRGPFWSVRPANVLVLAVVVTQILATFIAVHGFLMPPLGWKWAGVVWGYAAVWFVISDRAKLLAYRVMDGAGGGRAAQRDN